MNGTESLVKRIQAELEAGARRMEALRGKAVSAVAERDRRTAQFGKVCERLRAIWTPRLEAFAKVFGDKVAVKPSVTPTQRDVTMEFTTGLASVKLRLSASAALEAGNLVLEHDLSILPMLMDFERHAKLEQPLDKVDEAAVGAWIDDRLVGFVKTYNAMHENEHYLQGSMVEDPVAAVRFPKHAAAGTLERDGKPVYFVSAETMKEFERREAAAPTAKPKSTAKPERPAKPDVGATPPTAGKRAAPTKSSSPPKRAT